MCEYMRGHTRHRITRATVRNVIRISRRSSLDDRALAPVCPSSSSPMPPDGLSVRLFVRQRAKREGQRRFTTLHMREEDGKKERDEIFKATLTTIICHRFWIPNDTALHGPLREYFWTVNYTANLLSSHRMIKPVDILPSSSTYNALRNLLPA